MCAISMHVYVCKLEATANICAQARVLEVRVYIFRPVVGHGTIA